MEVGARYPHNCHWGRRMGVVLSLGMERSPVTSYTAPYIQESDGKRCLLDYVCQWLELCCPGNLLSLSILSPKLRIPADIYPLT